MAASVSWCQEEKMIRGTNDSILSSRETHNINQEGDERASNVLKDKVDENKRVYRNDDIKKGGLEPPNQG